MPRQGIIIYHKTTVCIAQSFVTVFVRSEKKDLTNRSENGIIVFVRNTFVFSLRTIRRKITPPIFARNTGMTRKREF